MAGAEALIGSLIDLYSMANIRYQGTLASYDQQNKTLTLHNGACARRPARRRFGRHG